MIAKVKQPPFLTDPGVQLMLRSKTGDEDAFRQLVEMHRDRLVNVLRRLLCDSQSAEDLAQEVFIRVYRARERYEPTAKFTNWLFAIAHNLAINAGKSKARRKEVSLVVLSSGESRRSPENLAVEQREPMPQQQLLSDESRQVVRAALKMLNERQRKAVLLQHVDLMTYADIGAEMMLTPEAVKSLLTRARNKLRGKLATYVT